MAIPISANVPAVAETALTFMSVDARMLSGAYVPQDRSAIGPFGMEAANAAGTGNGLVSGSRVHSLRPSASPVVEPLNAGGGRIHQPQSLPWSPRHLQTFPDVPASYSVSDVSKAYKRSEFFHLRSGPEGVRTIGHGLGNRRRPLKSCLVNPSVNSSS